MERERGRERQREREREIQIVSRSGVIIRYSNHPICF